MVRRHNPDSFATAFAGSQPATQEEALDLVSVGMQEWLSEPCDKDASAQCVVKAMTMSYLVMRSAAPIQVPAEVLRNIVVD